MNILVKHLYNRFFHFLWRVLPKRYEVIRETKISYVEIPFIMLQQRLFKSERNLGMVLRYIPSDTVMIFVVSHDHFRRYALYHEYREGEVLRAGQTTDQIVQTTLTKLPLLLEVFEGYLDISSEEFTESFRNWVKSVGAHAQALFDELELAREELSLEDFPFFCQEFRRRLTA